MNTITLTTNFDALFAIFIFITITAMLSPISQFFRNVLVNFIFMAALLFLSLKFGLDMSLYLNYDELIAFKDSFIQVLVIFGGTALFLRFRGDDSLYDTLFLGFGPYFVLFTTVVIGFSGTKLSEVSYFFTGLLIIFYIFFILKKLSISMFFSIKRIGDNY